MADEEKNKETEKPEPEAAEPEAAEPEAAEPEAAEPEAADAPEAEAEPEPEPPPAPDVPPETLTPKQRKRQARAAKAAAQPARPARSDEERHEERVAARARKSAERRTWREKERTKARANRPATEAIAPREHAPGRQKTRQGIVVSDRADKTITVRIDITRRHPLYEKIVRTSGTLHAHDESNDAHAGDTVVVRESRPLSRTKRWRLVEILERAK
jgi:small subunit ribosomal protein S17